MSQKMNFYNDLVPGSGSAVEPNEGYVYVVTKITFDNEGAAPGVVAARIPGGDVLVDKTVAAHGKAGWEGTQILKYGERMSVQGSPSGSIRCVVEGYFLADIPVLARQGAGSMDAEHAAKGFASVQDSILAKSTRLMLVELKQMRMLMQAQTGLSVDVQAAAEEADRELGS